MRLASWWVSGFVTVLMVVSTLEAQGADLEVGLARADISPPLGYRMAGYFSERFNDGTIDPLQAKAIVFRQGEELAAIVMCDLVAIDGETATSIRKAASKATGIPASQIAIAATHSHTGPLFQGVLRDKFHRDAIEKTGKDEAEIVDYSMLLQDQVVKAIVDAKEKAVPVELQAGKALETRLAFNRRFYMKDGPVRFNPGLQNPKIDHVAGPVDPEVEILVVRPRTAGKPIGALINFALHLDTVNGTKYSADYPFFLESKLQETYGKGFLSIFGTGTCGDINHLDVSQTTIAKTKAIGETLGATVGKAIPGLKSIEPRLKVASEVIEVPPQTVRPEEIQSAETLLKQFDPAKIPFLEIVRAVTVLDLASHFTKGTTPLEVQAFRLSDDTAIVTLPGEVFVELGLAIKQGSPFPNTFVIELANDCPSYIPTRKAFEEGSYEIVNSRVQKGGGELMVDAAIRLLKRLATP